MLGVKDNLEVLGLDKWVDNGAITGYIKPRERGQLSAWEVSSPLNTDIQYKCSMGT